MSQARPSSMDPAARPDGLARGAGHFGEHRQTAGPVLLGHPRTTHAGLDLVFLYLILALRAVDIARLVPALLGTAGRSPRPALDLALGALFIGWSLVLCSISLRDGSLRRRGWLVATDVTVACVCLVGVVAVTQPELRASQPDAWAASVAHTSALLAGLALTRRRSRIVAAAALGICALVPLGFVPGHPEIVLTGWGNALAYPAYTLIGWVAAASLGAVAHATDEGRAAAAREAAAAEAARHRALLHDQATILDLVARGVDDPVMADALRHQAGGQARKVAAFMTDPPLSTRAPSQSDLAALAARIASDFADLRPVLSVDLAAGTVLRADVAAVVSAALTTVLHNVRKHSRADQLVVHADADERGWELTVRDDGIGFDPDTARTGYGLGELVGSAGRRVGLDVTIDSAPGEGVTVVLRGGPESTVTQPRQAAEAASTRSRPDDPLSRESPG